MGKTHGLLLFLLVFLKYDGLPPSAGGQNRNPNGLPSPTCLTRQAGEMNSDVIRAAKISDLELLTRLVFAEGVSTGFETSQECSKQSSLILESIAWGVMNRVRLGRILPAAKKDFGSELSGVIFKPHQFNPAVSVKSKFSEIFLCPSSYSGWSEIWQGAQKGAQKALSSPEENPFLRTEWERKNQAAWVVQFYYPRSVQATPTPPSWVDVSPQSKTFVRDVQLEGIPLNTNCIWFFRRLLSNKRGSNQ